MKSVVYPAIVRRTERVVTEEEVISPESVVLRLTPEEFLALWALEYIKGDGNTPLRTTIERGLNTALADLMGESTFAKQFVRTLKGHEGYGDLTFVRIQKALDTAEEATA